MTDSKAAYIRAEILSGKRPGRSIAREQEREKIEAEKNKATIGKIWEDYQLLNSSKRSLITDQYNFKNHLSEFINRKPEELKTIDILKLRKKLEDKDKSPATVKHILVLLRMLINWGAKNGLCPVIDPSKLRFELPKLDNERTESLNESQLVLQLQVLNKNLFSKYGEKT